MNYDDNEKNITKQNIEILVILICFGIMIPFYFLSTKKTSKIESFVFSFAIIATILCIYFILYPEHTPENYFKYVNKILGFYIILGSFLTNSKNMITYIYCCLFITLLTRFYYDNCIFRILSKTNSNKKHFTHKNILMFLLLNYLTFYLQNPKKKTKQLTLFIASVCVGIYTTPFMKSLF
tara:strand:+ start:110 stop:649 length:540 start_codon:yes stop_codon:yes gene_type:complete